MREHHRRIVDELHGLGFSHVRIDHCGRRPRILGERDGTLLAMPVPRVMHDKAHGMQNLLAGLRRRVRGL